MNPAALPAAPNAFSLAVPPLFAALAPARSILTVHNAALHFTGHQRLLDPHQ
jgi:hypothetical protein